MAWAFIRSTRRKAADTDAAWATELVLFVVTAALYDAVLNRDPGVTEGSLYASAGMTEP